MGSKHIITQLYSENQEFASSVLQNKYCIRGWGWQMETPWPWQMTLRQRKADITASWDVAKDNKDKEGKVGGHNLDVDTFWPTSLDRTRCIDETSQLMKLRSTGCSKRCICLGDCFSGATIKDPWKQAQTTSHCLRRTSDWCIMVYSCRQKTALEPWWVSCRLQGWLATPT